LLDDEAGTPALSPDVASFQDASAALKAIATYYARFEPSNPALLLVRQAENLIGKSFLEVLRVLVPNYVESIAVQIGRAHVFDIPIERLSDFANIEEEAVSDGAGAKVFEVTTRDMTQQLLAKVGAFYHVAEPSSARAR
jgi:type VI secretion system protein ImpA